jgi:hypothetical protein
MAYVDSAGENPHVNYEPSSEGGLEEAQPRTRDYYQYVEGHVMRHELLRTQHDYKQPGERYRSFEEWERDDLLNNLANDLKQCRRRSLCAWCGISPIAMRTTAAKWRDAPVLTLARRSPYRRCPRNSSRPRQEA